MATAPAANRPWRKGLPIVAYLVFGVGGLIILSVGGVFLITLSIATRNTFELLGDNGRLLLTGTVRQVRQFLEPPEAQIEMLGRLIEAGRVDPSDPKLLFAALQASLAASPHVRSTVFLDPSGWLMAAVRTGPVPHPEIDEWSRSPDARKAMTDARGRGRKVYWGAPVYLKDPGFTVVNLRRPVIVDDRMRGLLASTITIQELSRFITGLETETGQNAFILYDRDYVLAHRALEFDFPGLSEERPLPRVREIGDPVLFDIWRDGWQERDLIAGSGHWGNVARQDY
ncbi:MAG: cache domain-containing protein, partial [Geminicoccales bacterium]